jgi:hypothetical protein
MFRPTARFRYQLARESPEDFGSTESSREASRITVEKGRAINLCDRSPRRSQMRSNHVFGQRFFSRNAVPRYERGSLRATDVIPTTFAEGFNMLTDPEVGIFPKACRRGLSQRYASRPCRSGHLQTEVAWEVVNGDVDYTAIKLVHVWMHRSQRRLHCSLLVSL